MHYYHKIKHIAIKFKDIYRIYKCFVYDFKYIGKYSLFSLSDTEDRSIAKIMLTMHGLEKGMSFSKKKANWGGERACYLAKQIEYHLIRYGHSQVIDIGLNILYAYTLDVNATKEPKYLNTVSQLLKEHRSSLSLNLGGVKKVNKPILNISYESIYELFRSRTSVRDFSDTPLLNEQISKAKDFAKLTPSACNRQTCKIYYFQDRILIKKIIDNQKGDQGWCYNCNTLFVITSNISYFNGTFERCEPYIDGGMFAMNFMIGLHVQNIASCYKMYIKEPKLEKEFRSLCKIPEYETPIVLILTGHYKEEGSFSPISYRL
jgi:nitroreductase